MSIFQAFRESLFNLNEAWKSATYYPYVAEFEVRHDLNTRSIDRTQFRGLLYVQLLVKDSSSPARLVSYWLDKPAFDQNKDAFSRAILGVPPPAGHQTRWEGTYQNTLADALPNRWKLLYPWMAWSVYWFPTAVIAIVACAAWIVSVNETSRKLHEAFGDPDIELVAAERPKKVLVGSELDLPIDVRNLSPYVKADISIDAQELIVDSGDKGGISLYPIAAGKFPVLDPSKKETFHVMGFAEKAGKYKVKLVVTARAGDLAKSEIDRKFEFPVEVWKDFGVGRKLVRKSDSRICFARVELLVGRRFEKGLRLTAKLEQEPDVLFDGTSMPGEFTTDYNKDEKKEVSLMTWKNSNPMGPMETSVVFIYLKLTDKAQGIDAERWQKIVDKIIVTHHDLKISE